MDTSQALCEQAQRHQCFFRQYQRLAYTVALRILKDARDAEEVASDAMARVLRAPEKYDSSRGSMKSYVALIARSQALGRLAARRDEVPVAAPEGPSAPDWAASLELRERLTGAVLALSEPEKQLFAMRFVYGYSTREMARFFGISQNAVTTRVSRLRDKLKPLLEEREGEHTHE